MSVRSYPDEKCHAILDYYFGEVCRDDCGLDALKQKTKFWFFRNAETDATIRARFADDVERAAKGELDAWKATPLGSLALIVLLDQFPRNLNRDSGRAFATDHKALATAMEGIERGYDASLSAGEKLVFYLPLMHSEDAKTQARGCELYQKLSTTAPAELKPELDGAYQFAERHKHIVDRFGRFPHRNKALGRESTPEELEFLTQPGSSF